MTTDTETLEAELVEAEAALKAAELGTRPTMVMDSGSQVMYSPTRPETIAAIRQRIRSLKLQLGRCVPARTVGPRF